MRSGALVSLALTPPDQKKGKGDVFEELLVCCRLEQGL